MRTWFITGASRGIGLEIARAALRAEDRVIVTSRNRQDLIDKFGADSERLQSLELDVADAARIATTVDAALSRFGAPDVLVNNAGYGHYGFFEELDLADARSQFETNLFGVINLCWALLPSMRAARRGRIFNVSSLAGLMAGATGSLYCASKFALEGFSESLAKELRPFGIYVTIVEPGPFRTDFLTSHSLKQRHTPVADYEPRRIEYLASVAQRSGRQPGDPQKLAQAIVTLSGSTSPPLRFLGGSLAVNAALEKMDSVRAEIEQWRELSVDMDLATNDSLDAASIFKTFK